MLYDESYQRELDSVDAQTRLLQSKLYDRLKAAPPEVWFYIAERLNWDEHEDIIFWMLNQPECDFSVACHALYHAGPAYYVENRKPLASDPGPNEIFSLVLRNWERGFYRSHAVAIVGRPLFCRSAEFFTTVADDLRRKIEDVGAEHLPFTIPEPFLAPEGGQTKDIPNGHHPEDTHDFWQIASALGIAVHHIAPGLERADYEINRKIEHQIRQAKRKPLGLAGWCRAVPSTVYALKQRKHFEDGDAFGDWFNVVLADRDLGELLLERQRDNRLPRLQDPGEATRNFTDTNGFYLLVAAVSLVVFGVWEFVLK